jgi:hypothetical protein
MLPLNGSRGLAFADRRGAEQISLFRRVVYINDIAFTQRFDRDGV